MRVNVTDSKATDVFTLLCPTPLDNGALQTIRCGRVSEVHVLIDMDFW